MALGKILRDAREQQGVSVAQVAESTHMMVQIVEEIEREDFRRIAAPIYGRGFIKLYAEFLSLDAEPLVKEFNTIYSGAQRPVVATRIITPAEAPPAPAAPEADPAAPPRQPIVAHQAVTPANLAPPPSAAPAVPARPELHLDAEPGAAASATAQALDDLFGTPVSRRQAAEAPGTRSAVGGEPPPPSLAARLGARGREGVAVAAAFVRAQAEAIGRLPLGRHPVPLAAAAGVLILAGLAVWLVGRRPAERLADESPASAPALEIANVLPPPDPYVD